MRTKQILTTMVLPALFAACTADDFVENNNVNIEGRALLNPITFNVGAPVDTRFTWNEAGFGNWTYENTDAFSAFLVDGTLDTPANKLLTNYIYKSKDGKGFTTTSQMVEGIYWFYAPAPEDKNTRDLIPFKLKTAQDADYYKSEEAQVFFTGLYKLTKEDDPQNIKLTMSNYYGRAVFPLTNNLDGNVKINQIILESNKDFEVEGEISVEALEDYMYGYTEDGELVSAKNLDEDNTNNETVEDLLKRLRRADIVAESAKTTKTLVLNLGEGATIARGATETFTMLVPRTEEGVYCKVKIITDKGVATISETDRSNYAKNVQFKHNGVMPIFGQKSDGSFKAYSIEKDNLDEMGGARYVTTYEEMIDLINTINGDIEVYNLGDWAVDNTMAKAIENSDSYVKFTQPITVKDEKNAVSLKKVEFADVTIAAGTEVSFDKANVAEKENVVAKMTIEKGAKVTLNAGKFAVTEGDKVSEGIINEGELKVAENAKEVIVASTSTLTLEDNTKAKVALNAGSLNYTTKKDGAEYKMSDLSFVESSKMASDLNITIGEKVTLVQDKQEQGGRVTPTNKVNNVTYVTNIVNDGTLKLGTSGLKVSGKLTNNKVVVGETETKTLTIEKSAEIAAGAVVQTVLAVTEDATVANYGEILNAINNGKITTYAGSRTTVNKGTGEVDNTAKAFVSIKENVAQTVTYVFANAVSSKDLDELDTELFKINKFLFKGAVTVDKELAKCNGVKTMEFASGSSLNIGANIKQGTAITNVVINGNVSFSGFDKDKSGLGFKEDATISIKKNCALTINHMTLGAQTNKKITFATSGTLSGNDKAGKVVNNGEVYAGQAVSSNVTWEGTAAKTDAYTGN